MAERNTMVTNSAIIAMSAVCVFTFVVPITLFILFKRKNADIMPFFIGCAVFVVFVLLIESTINSLIAMSPVGKTLTENTVLYGIYGGLMAGIFEETGRLIAFKTVLKKKLGKDMNALMYGAGHGGIEAVLILGTAMISNIVLSVMINNGQTQELVASLPPEAVTSVEKVLNELTSTAPITYLLSIAERISAVSLHLCLSVYVWFAVKNKKPLLYVTAVVIHAAADFLAVILSGYLHNIYLTEAILLVGAVGITAVTIKFWKSKKSTEVNYE